MSKDDIEASSAPLIEHLIELRQRLFRAVLALIAFFFVCFFFAEDIFNFLIIPYERAAGENVALKLIFTAPQEYFIAQIKVAFFAAAFLSFPIVANQIYRFIAPGLYKNERKAFLPFLVATPALFFLGGCLVFFVLFPMVMSFFMGMQQSAEEGRAAIELLPKVSEYLGLIMTLIFAFGLVFQLPVVIMLLLMAELVSIETLVSFRRYFIVFAFVVAAVLTPPDPLSQLGLAIPTWLLYEASILVARWVIKRRGQTAASTESGTDVAVS